MKEGLSGILGLCEKAGALAAGTEKICSGLRGKKIVLVLVSDSCSENTKKKLTDKCRFYGVKCEIVPLTPDEMRRATGMKSAVAAVGIKDNNLKKAIEEKLTLSAE